MVAACYLTREPLAILIRWNTSGRAESVSALSSGPLPKETYWVEARSPYCYSSDTIEVRYLSPPEAHLGSDTILCPGQVLNLNVYTPGASYRWNTGLLSPYHKIRSPGTYSVEVYNICGADTADIAVGYSLPPSLELGNDTSICGYRPLMLNAASQLEDVAYAWNTGEKSSAIKVARAGLYKVTLSNQCGIISDSIRVETDISRCQCSFFVPNVFTPNYDGVNDWFEVNYPCNLLSFNLNVYDRWGILMYHSESPLDRWDGTYKQQDCPSGTYYYILNYRGDDGQLADNKILKGAITLMR